MSDSFDPYRKWLGIPPADQPANHYRLLGIAQFEEDADVIAHAADRQMSHVRKFQSGQNGEFAQKLLSELAQARRCLLAAEERKKYDAQLRKEIGGAKGKSSTVQTKSQAVKPVPAPPQQAPPVAVMEPPKAVPVAVATPSPSPVTVRPRGGVSTTRRARKKNNMIPIIATLCVMAGLAGVALVVVVAATNDPESFSDPQDYVPPTTRVQQPAVQPAPQRPAPQQPKVEPRPEPIPAVSSGPTPAPQTPDEPRDIRDEINQTPPEDLPNLPNGFPGVEKLPKPGGSAAVDPAMDDDAEMEEFQPDASDVE